MGAGVSKTFKRETAAACLLLLWLLVLVAAVAALFGTDIDPLIKLAGLMSPPVFLFAGAAFGLDWHSKQCSKRVTNDGP